MNDRDVRDMLRRRAADVTPSPDAWERIAARLPDEGTASVVELAPRRRRPAPTVLGAVAAVALLLVAAVAFLQRGDDEDDTVRAAEPTPTSAPATTPTTVPGPTFETTAEQAARAWVRALGVGDLDQAWELLADPSRDAVGGRPGFEARRSELSEGWGTWEGSDGVTFRTAPFPGLGDDDGDLPAEIPRLAVVVLTGTVQQEGTTQFRTLSLPVRGTADDARVDPFVDVGISVEPGPGPSGDAVLDTDAVLGAYTPAAAAVLFVLDDRPPVAPDDVQGADGDQQYATLHPSPPLAEGRHSFTVAVLTADGRVASRSVVYTVSDTADPIPQSCGMVGFTPNSEDVAARITATRDLSCDAARAFVEVAGRQTSSGGPQEVDVDGFHCVRTESSDDPLPTSTYRCTKGDAAITFVRS